MSQITIGDLHREVRALVGDRSQRGAVVEEEDLNRALDRAIRHVSRETDGGISFITAFLTLAAADYDYAVSATYVDLALLNNFRLASDGREIKRVSHVTLQQMRTGTTIETGPPNWIAFDESGSGALTAYLHPVPSAVDTVQALITTTGGLADTLAATGGAAFETLNDVAGYIKDAMVYQTAGELVSLMEGGKLATLGLAPDAGMKLMASATQVIARENERLWKSRRATETRKVSQV